MDERVEVFRELHLRSAVSRRSELRHALILTAVAPWSCDPDSAETVKRHMPDVDILTFRHNASDDLEAANLTLLSTDDGYYVANIVPIELRELTIAKYNGILADFIERIVKPVASKYGYEIDVTEAFQSPEDWTSTDAARKLRVFSAAANQSSGASHPMDQSRWFDFIVAVHQSGKTISTDHLYRWLSEVDGWDSDSAHELAGQFETALSLLQHYDKH